MYDHHDAVLHAVREGLVVVDSSRPVLVNDEARRLLGTVEPLGIPEFMTSGTEPLRDVLVAEGGRVLMVNRSPVPGRDAAVITIRDRTEVAEAMGELDSMTRFAERCGRRRTSRPTACTRSWR